MAAKGGSWRRNLKGAEMKESENVSESWLCHPAAENRSEVHCCFVFKVIVPHQIPRAPSLYSVTNQGYYRWAGFRKAETVSIRDRNKRASRGSSWLWEMMSNLWKRKDLKGRDLA